MHFSSSKWYTWKREKEPKYEFHSFRTMNGVMTAITAVAVSMRTGQKTFPSMLKQLCISSKKHHFGADPFVTACICSFAQCLALRLLLLFPLTLNQYYSIWSCELFTRYQVIYVNWHVCIVCLYYQEYLTSLTVFYISTLSFNWSKIQKFMKQWQVFSGVCTLYAMCHCYSCTMRMLLFVPLTLFGCFYSCYVWAR